MLTLARALFDIVLLRRGPRELPASRSLLGALALGYFALSLAVAHLSTGPDFAITRALLDIGSLVGAFSALLVLRGLGHRVPQTLCALLGTGIVLMLADLVLLAALPGGEPRGAAAMLIELSLNLVFLWSVVVTAHIVRAALDVPLLAGLAVASSYAVVMVLVALQLPKAPAL